MGKEKLRQDKTCLNCRYVVENRYCPNCGQENTDTRKTFHHLFVHFFEDLTHYENAFWKTIRNLLFKPSSLTKEYLSGKRLSYLAPVRLYIFISFITFFMIAVLPSTDLNASDLGIENDTTTITTQSEKDSIPKQLVKLENDSIVADSSETELDSIEPDSATIKKIKALKDSLNPAIQRMRQMMKSGAIPEEVGENIIKEMEKNIERQENDEFDFGFGSEKELDSVQKYGSEDDKMPEFIYKIQKKFFALKKKNTKEELIEKFREGMMHNFPKALFIYMPVFAFFLWLFHSKKRWFYFDHGIFTLHYFSFLLLITLILILIERFLYLFGTNLITIGINGLLAFVGYCWMFYYFFPAHHRFYGESRIISLIKSLGLLFINMFLMLFTMLGMMAYTLLTMH